GARQLHPARRGGRRAHRARDRGEGKRPWRGQGRSAPEAAGRREHAYHGHGAGHRQYGALPRHRGRQAHLRPGDLGLRRGALPGLENRGETPFMAAAQGKVIITCAVTGSIHTPTMSPHLPITPDEIAEAALQAARAGAAIVHLHARDPKDGRPTQHPELFRQLARKIQSHTDVVINFTTGGAPTMSIEERLQPTLRLKPEVASLNMGSMNFGLYEMLGRYKEFKHDWEKPYLAGSDDRIFK